MEKLTALQMVNVLLDRGNLTREEQRRVSHYHMLLENHGLLTPEEAADLQQIYDQRS